MNTRVLCHRGARGDAAASPSKTEHLCSVAIPDGAQRGAAVGGKPAERWVVGVLIMGAAGVRSWRLGWSTVSSLLRLVVAPTGGQRGLPAVHRGGVCPNAMRAERAIS